MVDAIRETKVLKEIRLYLQSQSVEAYLVGGYIRDCLLGRTTRDIDFAVRGRGIDLARQVADHFGGAFVLLDQERDTARAVLRHEEDHPYLVDFTGLRGGSLSSDLAARDFTINALALDIQNLEKGGPLIDPFDGLGDLHKRSLRVVSPTVFQDDPLRLLRAARLSAQLDLYIEEATEGLMRRDPSSLALVSPERIRDELALILALPTASRHLRRLDELGLLGVIWPELEELKGVEQPYPHHLDVFHHALKTVEVLEGFLTSGFSFLDREPALPANLVTHFATETSARRRRDTMLKLAALLHDAGKPKTRSTDANQVHFHNHEVVGAEIAGSAIRRLRFSRGEVTLIRTIVRNHMRPLLLAKGEKVTKRAVYRFFRDSGDAGVDILVHSLADHLATWGPNLDRSQWEGYLALVNSMLTSYYEEYETAIAPPKLISGRDLMERFDLEAGPRLGQLLEAVREAQVQGEVVTREEALDFVAGLLADGSDKD